MSLNVYLIPPSPNNTKVLVALAYKGIEYTPHVINPQVEGARGPVIAASSQPLTPSLNYNGIKQFDSGAIMRFLDANFDGPRLYSEDSATLKQIERWEHFHTFAMGPFIARCFGQLFAEEPDADELAAINAGINEVTLQLEEALAADGGRQWLVGDSMTAADIAVGCYLGITCLNDEQAAQAPIMQVMQSKFDLGEGRERSRDLCHRVLAHLPSFASLMEATPV